MRLVCVRYGETLDMVTFLERWTCSQGFTSRGCGLGEGGGYGEL